MSLALYENLQPIIDFTKITEIDGFIDVPADWSVILTDLRGSTQAIESGRYKDVNLIGASAIAVVKNILGTREFPFVFGGDGATILLPKTEAEKVRIPLQQLQNHAEKNFSMNLRVGIVPMAKVIECGGKIQIAKYQMSPGAYVGLFRGGGVQIAENLIKTENSDLYLLAPNNHNETPPLRDLSCRWAPIPNRNGTIVSVIIQPQDQARALMILRRILNEIHPIFEAERFRPIHLSGLRTDHFWKNLRREIRLRKDLDLFGLLRRVLTPILSMKLMNLSAWSLGKKFLNDYLTESLVSSDYKKLDDTLRMVLDCSHEQSAQLEELLRKYYLENQIYYGIHRSEAALMTCIVEGLEKGKHIHFVDGANGGYALAAKQLKKQRVS